jgi:putative ABC transport system permease protein
MAWPLRKGKAKMDNNPPRLTVWIITLLTRSGNRQTLIGDLAEEYNYICSEQGRVRANLWYWRQIFIPFIHFIQSHIFWSFVMLANYLKTAFRNIKKHKSFTVINISGLAIGLACCILLAVYIHSELSFDSYHTKKDRIFRLGEEMSFNNFNAKQTATNGVIASTLKNNYPEIEETARFRYNRTTLKYKEKQFSERFYYADPAVFNIFSWPLLQGDPNTALHAPYSIVLSQETASKYFGSEDPMGKIVTIDDNIDYTVTGIVADVPPYSTLRFKGLLSFSTLYNPDIMAPRILSDWISHNFNSYVLLKEGVAREQFEPKIRKIDYEYAGEEMEATGSSFLVFLQPLKDIYLRSLNRDFGPISYVYIFSAVAVFILLIACVNFMNLSTSRSITRATEVGVRKVLGANRSRLIKQFLTEALLLSIFSMMIAVVIAIIMLPVISEYAQRDLTSEFFNLRWLIPALVASTLFVGLLAGSYPAFILSRFQPVQVIKNKFSAPKANTAFRRVLVVTQFVISITLIIGTALVVQQLDFLKSKDAGFDKEHVVCISIRDQLVRQTLPVLQNKLRQLPQVVNSGAASRLPGWSGPMNSKIPEGYSRDNTQLMRDINVDEHFLPTLGIEIVEGRNFSKKFSSDPYTSVIINQTAAKKYGWDNPIGKIIQTHDRDKTEEIDYVDRTVIGVVKDFHISPLTSEIQPAYIGNEMDCPYDYGKIHALATRIRPGDTRATLDKMEEIWKDTFADKPFNYYFLDEDFAEQFYRIERSRNIISYFTFLAIFIACLGLFGMVAYAAESRTKEIGIRKTLGSSVTQIMALLSKELVALVLVANVIAYPIAWVAISQWLKEFPYRIDMNLYTFLWSTLLALVISLLTISYQSLKAATANPVDALKYE